MDIRKKKTHNEVYVAEMSELVKWFSGRNCDEMSNKIMDFNS